MKHAVFAGAVAAIAALAAGCASASGPPASPGPPSAAQSSRPRAISMTGIDPCSVLTDDQISRLGLKFATKYDNPPSQISGNVRSCGWQSGGFEPDSGIYVQGVTYRGYADIRADVMYPQTEFDLRGYRAVTRDNSSPRTNSCEVFVDVADGQTFEVAYDHDAGGDPAVACRRAKQAAEFGMAYLLSR